MAIRKEITEDNELLLWMNGKLIYKRWLDLGYSMVFDKAAYGKNTFISIVEDESGNDRHRKKIFLNGYTCNSTDDFWKMYASQVPMDSARHFGENLDAFSDAILSGGPGFPGDCLIEIVGIDKLERLFGKSNFEFVISILRDAEYIDLIAEKK